MDNAVSIRRHLDAMGEFHRAGVRTTCFISPIFPGITDAQEIIWRVRERCNLIWLENLNLRGEYKFVIMSYIAKNYPQLLLLYQDIYNRANLGYWRALDEKLKAFAARP